MHLGRERFALHGQLLDLHLKAHLQFCPLPPPPQGAPHPPSPLQDGGASLQELASEVPYLLSFAPVFFIFHHKALLSSFTFTWDPESLGLLSAKARIA